MAGYWLLFFSFFSVFINTILAEQAWSIKGLLYGIKHQNNDFSFCGLKLEIPTGPAQVANHSAGFGSSGPLAELVIK